MASGPSVTRRGLTVRLDDERRLRGCLRSTSNMKILLLLIASLGLGVSALSQNKAELSPDGTALIVSVVETNRAHFTLQALQQAEQNIQKQMFNLQAQLADVRAYLLMLSTFQAQIQTNSVANSVTNVSTVTTNGVVQTNAVANSATNAVPAPPSTPTKTP